MGCRGWCCWPLLFWDVGLEPEKLEEEASLNCRRHRCVEKLNNLPYFTVIILQFAPLHFFKLSYFSYLLTKESWHTTPLQGGCKSENQCLQILIEYTFPCSKWRITLEKVQNWSLYSVKSVFWKDAFLSFTSKIWSELRKSVILVFM